jgi:hypothetical protein
MGETPPVSTCPAARESLKPVANSQDEPFVAIEAQTDDRPQEGVHAG